MSGQEDERTTHSILVTGGAGYIGSHLCRMLLESGHKVTVVDKFMFGSSSISTLQYFYPNEFKMVSGDIRDSDCIRSVIKGHDTVVHLAAIVGDPACSVRVDEAVEVNYEATKALAKSADNAGVDHFIFASTCSVYGASEEWLDETSEVKPISLYGQTKMSSEKFLLSEQFKNLEIAILRLGTVFGLSPRMRFDLVVNYLTQKAIMDGEVHIFGGNQWRPFVHVKDVARAFAQFVQMNNWNDIAHNIFNVGSDKYNYKITELGNVLKTVFPRITVSVVKEAQDHRSYKVRFSKIQEIAKFYANTTLIDGIKEISNAIWNGMIVDPQKSQYYNYRVWQ